MSNEKHSDLIERLFGVGGNSGGGSSFLRSARRAVADWCVVKHALIGCRAALGGTVRTRAVACQCSFNLRCFTQNSPRYNYNSFQDRVRMQIHTVSEYDLDL